MLSGKITSHVNKTKEIIVDFRKQQREHPPIHIDIDIRTRCHRKAKKIIKDNNHPSH